MLRVMRRWWYRPAIRMGSVDNSRIRTTRTRNAQFVSYLVDSGFRVASDHYEAGLRRRRVVKRILFWLFVVGGAWLIVESARALAMA